jgi:hypothetical protein
MFQQPVSLRRIPGAVWPAPAQYPCPAPPAPSPGTRTSASDLTTPWEFSSNRLSVCHHLAGPGSGCLFRHLFPDLNEYKFLFLRISVL